MKIGSFHLLLSGPEIRWLDFLKLKKKVFNSMIKDPFLSSQKTDYFASFLAAAAFSAFTFLT